MEGILQFLNSYSVIITVASVMIIAFARSIIRIFRMGVTFKTELATKQELREFEAEVRKDMRAYSVQIQKIVIDSVMTVINNKLKDIEDAKEATTQMKVMKAELEAEVKAVLERIDDVKSLGDTVRILGAKVARIEQQGTDPLNAAGRRHE